jgi:hypothetical protein
VDASCTTPLSIAPGRVDTEWSGWKVKVTLTAVVLRVLRGESLEELPRELQAKAHRVAAWRDDFLAADEQGSRASSRRRSGPDGHGAPARHRGLLPPAGSGGSRAAPHDGTIILQVIACERVEARPWSIVRLGLPRTLGTVTARKD